MCSICYSNPCRAGCPNSVSEIIGQCAQCRREIESDERFFTDSLSNIFCDEQCAAEYYGIRESSD